MWMPVELDGDRPADDGAVSFEGLEERSAQFHLQLRTHELEQIAGDLAPGLK
jgi:hypothetical protein